METVEDKVEQYTDKAMEMKTTITGHVNKLKDHVDTVRETVVDHVENITQKLVEKAQELREMAMKQVEKIKKRYDDFLKQYENALERAVEMLRQAEADLKKVLARLCNGSQGLYERAKELATNNIRVAQGYMNKVQEVFTKQMERLTSQVSIENHVLKITSLRSRHC